MTEPSTPTLPEGVPSRWLSFDLLKMGMHIEQWHRGDPEGVSLACSTCKTIMQEAQQHVEERDERIRGLSRLLESLPWPRT